jgi:hypothetical protein
MFLSWVALLLASAGAQTETLVVSIFDGKTPFLLVHEDEEGSSQRPPGIYGSGDKGQWFPIKLGKILRGRACTGLVAQFEVTKLDHRYASLAIVDGRLTLFELTADGTSQVAVLGEGAFNVETVDGQFVRLPLIEDLSQVHVSQLALKEAGQRVLISVRTPEAPLGDGVTFALYLQPTLMGNPGPTLGGKPLLIEHHFLPVSSLEHQGALVDPLVFSRPVARAIWFREWKRIGRHIEPWLDFVHSFIAQEEPLFLDLKENSNLPLVHLPSRSITMHSLPQFEVSAGAFLFQQTVDVLEGLDKVKISSGGPSSVLHGRLHGKKEGSETRFFVEGAYQDPDAAIALISGELFFFLKRKELLMISLGRNVPETQPEKVSFVVRELTGLAGKKQVGVVLSTCFKETKQTTAYLLEYSDVPLHLTKSLDLGERWFSEKELLARFQHPQFEHETGEFIFDVLSLNDGSAEAYYKNHSDFIPHLNLSKTTHPSQPEYSYKHALERQVLLEGAATFKRYEKGPEGLSPTGLYLQDASGYERLVLEGEMLQHPLTKSAGEYLLAERAWKLDPHPALPMKLSLFAMGANSMTDIHRHKMVGIVSVLDTTKEHPEFLPSVVEWPVACPIEDLKNVLLLPVFFNRICYWLVLMHYESPQGDTVRPFVEARAFTFVEPPSQEGIRSGKWVPRIQPMVEMQLAAVLSKGQDTWLESLKVDTKGNVYWLLNPEVGAENDQVTFKHLLTKQLHFPNRFRERGLEFLSNTDVEHYVREGLLRYIEPAEMQRSINRLGLWTRYDVQRMFDVRSEDLERAHAQADVFQGLDGKLHELVRFEDRMPSRDILLVSKEKQDQLFHTMLAFLTHERSSKVGFSMENRSLYFSGLDPSNESQSEWISSLDMLREFHQDARVPILIGRLEDVLRTGSLKLDGDYSARYLLKSEFDEDQSINPILAYWLATEGRRIELKSFQEHPSTDGKIQMILIGSDEDLAELKKGKYLAYPGQTLLKYFKVHDDFFTGEWKMWGPDSSNSSRELRVYQDQPFSDLDLEVLPSLSQTLEHVTNKAHHPEHRVLLVPPGLKSLVDRMIFGRWVAKDRDGDIWNYKNPRLHLYTLPSSSKVTQEGLVDNFQASRMGRDRHRSVWVGHLTDVIRAGRAPWRQGHKEIWEPRGWKIRDGAEELASQDFFMRPEGLNPGDKKNNHLILPHTLYWLATEGRPISLDSFSEVGVQPEVSILLIGERSEWNVLEREANVENRFGLQKAFQVETLQPPEPETKRLLLASILERPEIRRIGYAYFAQDLVVGSLGSPLTPKESETKLLNYLVNRAETLAQQFSQESTSAFIRVLTAFKNAVVEDPELRAHKRIDRSYLERLLSRIFSIPLNLNVLAPTDPYVLLSHERSALRLQEAGYRGPLELKTQVISTLLAPTRNDPTRSIPGSIIIFGDSSTGKTMLFKTMMKMLGLKEYLYGQPRNDESQFLVLNVGKLTTRAEQVSGEVMLVDEALKHVNHFLSLPFGFRGHILFDDLHKGDKEVLRATLKFLQSLFDADQGMVRVDRLGGSFSEIPVRNLHLWLTLNPTQDQRKIERYTKGKQPTDVDVVVATLSSEDNPIERSFLLRWGLVLNLSRFPIDAKAPALHDSLRTSSRNNFNVQGRLVFVSPEAVTKVVEAFPDSNAREFLSAATSQLLQAAEEGRQRAPLSIVVPRTPGAQRSHLPTNWEASGRENGTIEQFIRNQMVALLVNEQPEGQLYLLRLMLDSLRTQWYQVLVDNLTQDERFAGSSQALKHCLTPILQAMHSQLKEKPFIPLYELNLDPHDLVLERPRYADFARRVASSEDSGKAFFDPAFLRSVDSFHSTTLGSLEDVGRETVLAETLEMLQAKAQAFLSHVLRVRDVKQLPRSEDWIHHLTDEDPLQELDAIGQEVLTLYFRFWNELFDARLIESRHVSKFRPLSTYDVARLFTLLLDKAMASLDWGKVTHFMIQNLKLLSEDLEIGQRPVVQYYLFNARFSLVKVFAHEQVFQIAYSSQAFRDWSPEFSARLESDFHSSVWCSFSKRGGR